MQKYIKRCEEVTLDQFLILNKAAAGQLYKKYDLMGIVGLGIGRNWEDPSDWWCSELVAYLLKCVGLILNGWGRKVNTYTPPMWLIGQFFEAFSKASLFSLHQSNDV